jgi:hypothetical protein
MASGAAGLRGGRRFRADRRRLNRLPGETQARSCRREQGPLGIRRAFHPGIPRQFYLLKAGPLQECQESLSRHGPTHSLIPVIDAVGPLRREGIYQHHVRQMQVAAGFENPENFLGCFFLVDDQVKSAV